MKIKIAYIITFLLSFCCDAKCQQNYSDADSALFRRLFIKNNDLNRRNWRTDLKNMKDVTIFNALDRAENEALSNDSFSIMKWRYTIGSETDDIVIRQRATFELIRFCKNRDMFIAQQATNWLMNFNSTDFSALSKKLILESIDTLKKNHKNILILGIAQIRDLNGQLNAWADNVEIVAKSKRYSSLEWYSAVALARMGNQRYIAKLIKLIESEPNDITRVTKLLPYAGFIRQPVGITLLVKYLKSDERLASSKTGALGQKISDIALDHLSVGIKDFPVKNSDNGYSDAEKRTALEWVETNPKYEIVR